MATEDATCTPSGAEQIYAEFTGATEKHILYEEGWGHNEFGFDGSKAFVDRMVETIETGTVTKPTSTLEPVTGSFFSRGDGDGGSFDGVIGIVLGICSALVALGIHLLLCYCCKRAPSNISNSKVKV